jgi:hypothetical protein
MATAYLAISLNHLQHIYMDTLFKIITVGSAGDGKERAHLGLKNE